MHGVRPTVRCPANLIGTPQQTIKIKRGGAGQTSGSGPSGWKKRPRAVLCRSLAEMARHYVARGAGRRK